MVEIFKTNVTGKRNAAGIIKILHTSLPDHGFNFDLDDPDHILRAENRNCLVQIEAIVKLVMAQQVSISLVAE